MEHVGATQPDQREHILTNFLTGTQKRKKHPAYTPAVICLFGGM